MIKLALNNAAYQHCYLVREYAILLNIHLEFLPSYSPNLNLIERLWKFIKKQCLNNCYDETFAAFKLGIDACLNDVDKKYKSQITSLMPLRFHVFKNDRILAG